MNYLTALSRCVLCGQRRPWYSDRHPGEACFSCNLGGASASPINSTGHRGCRLCTLHQWQERDNVTVHASGDAVSWCSSDTHVDLPRSCCTASVSCTVSTNGRRLVNTDVSHIFGLLFLEVGGVDSRSSRVQSSHATGLKRLAQYRFSGRGSDNTFRYFGPNAVVLVSRQSHGSQNTDDRHHDHQFDQGETLLQGTLHKSSSELGNSPRRGILRVEKT